MFGSASPSDNNLPQENIIRGHFYLPAAIPIVYGKSKAAQHACVKPRVQETLVYGHEGRTLRRTPSVPLYSTEKVREEVAEGGVCLS
ncbi:hypothetical protein J6590_079837 [Homalodisca vitripennis]|nr:hypothetical protein J6590_079837 [Homalodisca vitripennis]